MDPNICDNPSPELSYQPDTRKPSSKEILEFIRPFNKVPELVKFFTDGYCYYFAIILVERFGAFSDIMYNPIVGHFGCRINGHIYDVTGIVNDEQDFVPWDTWERDSGARQAVIDGCILKS